MRIAYVRSTLHTGSGLVNHIMEIANRVKLAGNYVRIISRRSEVELKDTLIHEMHFAGDRISFIRNLIFPFKILSFLDNFDLVHTQYHPGIFVGNISAKFLEKPHVFTYHGFAPISAWQNPKQELKMIDHRVGTLLALHSNVDRIITVSHFLERELVKEYYVKQNRIRVIYNGVDTQRFNLRLKGDEIRSRYKLENHPVVLYLGRLAPYKGVHFLIKAIPKVLEELPETKFLVSGAMRYDVANLNRLTKCLKVKDAVVFSGYVSDLQVPMVYATCDVFCYPSLWEGFGLTPAEAQACGKPVVAFDNCALPEVVKDGQTGLLVEPRNVDALSEALLAILHDDERRIRMGLEARKRVLRLFSWDKAAQQTMQVYNEVLS